MNDIWVTSDQHFGHHNILRFQADTRPFSNKDIMDDEIVIRHNKKVKPEDEVYFLGDFAFVKDPEYVQALLQAMNGTKYFIFGNHDKIMYDPRVVKEFVWMKSYYELRISNRGKKQPPIVMCHYPIYSWNRMHHGALHFYGHTHGAIPIMAGGRGKDVGLDCNDCYPFNVRDLIDEMTQCEVIDARAG